MRPQEASLARKIFTGGGEWTHVCLHFCMLDAPGPRFCAQARNSAVWVWNQMIKRTGLAFPFPSSTLHIPIFLSKADVLFFFFLCPNLSLPSRYVVTRLRFRFDYSSALLDYSFSSRRVISSSCRSSSPSAKMTLAAQQKVFYQDGTKKKTLKRIKSRKYHFPRSNMC